MEFSFMTAVSATKEKIWDFYSDIQKWYVWERDLKNITLDQGFKTGSVGVMELEGMPPMEYTLTAVKENEEFWDITKTPAGSIYFGHELTEADDQTVQIKHTVRLEGDGNPEETVELLKQIFADVPDSVLLLKKKVERND